jgi:hypothetical protein
LELSKKYQMRLARHEAIKALSALNLTPVGKFMLARSHLIASWIGPCLIGLLRMQITHLAPADFDDLGGEIISFIVRTQHQVRMKRLSIVLNTPPILHSFTCAGNTCNVSQWGAIYRNAVLRLVNEDLSWQDPRSVMDNLKAAEVPGVTFLCLSRTLTMLQESQAFWEGEEAMVQKAVSDEVARLSIVDPYAIPQ